MRSGEFAKAISKFEQALKLSPDTAEVHAGFGGRDARSGNLDQAIVHLDVVVLKPQLAGVQLALARLLEARGAKPRLRSIIGKKLIFSEERSAPIRRRNKAFVQLEADEGQLSVVPSGTSLIMTLVRVLRLKRFDG